MPARIVLLGLCVLATTFCVVPQQATSCPIPVYRYALEYWEPDPYRITIYTTGTLTQSEEEIYNRLVQSAAGREAFANIDVNLVNLEANPHAPARQHPDIDPLPDTPWMAVQYPRISANNNTVWHGPFTMSHAERLLDSPARRTLANHLAQGSMVWLFLESDHSSKNREALSVLKRELDRLEQTLVLPDPEQWWTNRDGVDPPEIRFEIVTVSKHNPAELALAQMLLRSEDDLQEFDSEPMVFPVYGRGIALWAIVGSGINTWNITDAAEFLTGPCSCQVKMLNPGIDLLVSKDWEASVESITDALLTPLTGFSEFEQRGEEFLRRLEEQPLLTEAGTGLATSDRRPVDTAIASPGTRTNTASDDHAYTDIFEDLTHPEGEAAPITPQTGGAALEGFSLRLIAVILGVMVLVGIAGYILFTRAENEKGSKQ